DLRAAAYDRREECCRYPQPVACQTISLPIKTCPDGSTSATHDISRLQYVCYRPHRRMNLFAAGYLVTAGWLAWMVLFTPRGVGFVRRTQLRLGFAVCAVWALLISLYGDTLPEQLHDRLLPIGEVLRYGGLLLVLGALNNAPRGAWLQRLNAGAWVLALL